MAFHSPWHAAFAFLEKKNQPSHYCIWASTPIPLEVHSIKLHQLCNNPYKMCSMKNFLTIVVFCPMYWTLVFLQNWWGRTQFVWTIRNKERKGYLSFPFCFFCLFVCLPLNHLSQLLLHSFPLLLPAPSIFQMLQASLKSLVIFSAFLKSSSPRVISAVIF